MKLQIKCALLYITIIKIVKKLKVFQLFSMQTDLTTYTDFFLLQTQRHSCNFVFTQVKTASLLYKCNSVTHSLSTAMADLKKSFSERNSSHAPSVLSDLISNSLHPSCLQMSATSSTLSYLASYAIHVRHINEFLNIVIYTLSEETLITELILTGR